MQTPETQAAVTWFQTDDYGVIDRLEHEQVVTSFYRMLLPIWPEYSAYVIRAADGSEQRIKIPLQRKSVLLGYLRWHTWMAALFFGAPAIWGFDRFAWMIVPALVFVGIAGMLTWGTGKLSEQEALRRGLLRRVVGFGAPPELLSDSMRAEVRSNLELMWATKSERSWIEAIGHGEASELLVALAEYHQAPELIEAAHANFSSKLWN